jgi:hypothetical protein
MRPPKPRAVAVYTVVAGLATAALSLGALARAQPEDCVDLREPNDRVATSSVITLSARGHDMDMTTSGCIEGADDVDHYHFVNPRRLPWRGQLDLVSSSAITHEVSSDGQSWVAGRSPLGGTEPGGYFVRVRRVAVPLTTPEPYNLVLDAIQLSPTPESSATPEPRNEAFVPLLLKGR